MSAPSVGSNPAKQLEGMVLDGNWTVGPLLPKRAQATGGTFCQCYKVYNERGKEAFLKVLDFQAAFQRGSDLTDFIEKITVLFNFERDLLNVCSERGMDRVVRAIGGGITQTEPENPYTRVPYLIFEAADTDIRVHLDIEGDSRSISWKLRAIHHVATGLKQLHGAEIVHQDLKPSNVLVFHVEKLPAISKVADLGRASKIDFRSPYDVHLWAGDYSYAPPEAQYAYTENDWFKRRVSADLYTLGGLMSFIFCKTTSIAELLQHLPKPFWPGNWGGTFPEVLPYLHGAFSEACSVFESELPPKLRVDLMPNYEMLCNPDPTKRVPAGVRMNKNALEKILSRFDLLASRAYAGRYD